MSQQVQAYLEEMNKVYLAIMKKCVDSYELSEADIIFLEVYNRTIKGKVNLPE